MCLGRHPRTGSTAILFSGIQFFLYATLQAEAMVIHSCLKFEISYGLVSVVWPAFAQLQEWSPRSQIFRHWHPPIHSLKNKKITRFILSSYHKHTCKKIYNLNFPVQHPRSNSTIGNPDESSSVSSEKHHVYCFPSVPLIIKIKGYKPKTDR